MDDKKTRLMKILETSSRTLCLILAFCLGLFHFQLDAQGWKHLYSDQPASEVVASPDGGYYLLADNEVLKIDAEGEVVWTHPAFSPATHRMTATPDGGLIYTSTNSSFLYELIKLDADGQISWFVERDGQNVFNPVRVMPVVVDDLWRVQVGSYNSDSLFIHTYDLQNGQLLMETALDNSLGNSIHDLAVIAPGDLAVLTSFADQEHNHHLLRIDEFGNLLTSTTLDTTFYRANTLLVLPDGSTVVCGLRDAIDTLPYPSQPILVQKIAPDGASTEWVRTLQAAEGNGPSNYFSVLTFLYQGTGLTLGADGYLYLAGIGYQGDPTAVNPHLGWGIADPYLVKMDTDGNLIFERRLLNTALSYEFPLDIIQTAGGELAIAGESDGRAFLLRTDSLGYVYSNRIYGQVARTAADDCQLDGAATPLEHWIVQAGNGNELFYGLVDENGEYEIRTDSGDYLVTVFQPGPYWEVCQDSQIVAFPGFYLEDSLDLPVNALVDCPYMEIDIASPFLRRCFNSTYFVNYCNNGTDTAYNVEVIVSLDPYLELVSPPAGPWFPIDDLHFGFTVGQVAPGECGQFSFVVLPDCEVELGWTHCTEVTITPDSLCLTPPLWNGAEVSVDGACENADSVRFILKNIGQEDMTAPLNYIVIEDHMIMYTDQIAPLDAGAQFDLLLEATGGTYRVVAEQVPGFPYPGHPTVAVEGCGDWSNPGFVILFPENEGSPFTAIDCQENVGAFDPNDKQAFPYGYDSAHYIEAETELEYRIRFQNTGTDTAFNVLILDTLSAQLDLSSVRPGASSHPYQFSIRDGGVLAFEFPDIMLPDSNVNLAGSQGFLNFRVAQTPGNLPGTEIYNEAAIYFDFNEPVLTNQTWHTVGSPLISGTVEIWEDEKEGAQVEVFPNPFTTQTNFWIEEPMSDAHIQVYDLQGRLVHEQPFEGHTLQLSADGLPAGVLFFRISSQGRPVASGTIVLTGRP